MCASSFLTDTIADDLNTADVPYTVTRQKEVSTFFYYYSDDYLQLKKQA